MKNLILISLILVIIVCLPSEEMLNPPVQFEETEGMSDDEVAYSGYLKTKVEGRQIHYVFAQARKNFENAPLTIWFNGGPGCSSLIGYLQEIGPYFVGNKYKEQDRLTKNEYSWNQISNLLFLESPALVGFSTDKNISFKYNDVQTADDAFAAILDFFENKAPEFQSRKTILAGESYAGKYIPDVATRILAYNQNLTDKTKGINLTGLLIGNGVMNFMDNSLNKSNIEYMIEHDFVDDRLQGIYKDACLRDFDSPRCNYFQYELKLDKDNVNPYNIYEFCKEGKSAETIRMIESIAKLSSINKRKLEKRTLKGESGSLKLDEINECPSDDGAIQYLNINKKEFYVDKVGKEWEPCTDIDYEIDAEGSMREYIKLFLSDIKIWLYNGDWDDVVPYRDTEKNLDLLQKRKIGAFEHWTVDEHHAGFYQVYDGALTVITVKGASHMVPQSKPKQSYQMFYNFVNNRPINTDVF